MLPQAGLVTMHSGNASGYDVEADMLYIKPSGMDYDAITPENLVAVKVSTGEVLTKGIRPSVDLPHHLFLYRNIEGVRGVIHTHSNHATAFAAPNRPVPLVLTTIADEFGAEIPAPCTWTTRASTSARLSSNTETGRRPFSWATTACSPGVHRAKSALKAAIMTEDVAKTVWLACVLGEPKVIPPDEAEKWYDRYHNRYGQ